MAMSTDMDFRCNKPEDHKYEYIGDEWRPIYDDLYDIWEVYRCRVCGHLTYSPVPD